MKPFSMEPVLKYRKRLEDQARQELYQALEEEAEIFGRCTQTKAELELLCDGLQHDREHGTTVDRLTLFENRIVIVQELLHSVQDELSRSQERVSNKRQKLIQASKDRKVLEKLKEQQNASYKKYLDKKEAVMLDEIAVLFYDR